MPTSRTFGSKTLQSVDLFNRWFMKFAPRAFRDTRIRVTKQVEEALLLTDDLRGLSPALIQNHPRILPTLRMCTCPPLARDRLIGLSGAGKSLVGTMEAGSIPPRMPSTLLVENLARIVRIISRMLDKDILPWRKQRGRSSLRQSVLISCIPLSYPDWQKVDQLLENGN
jgi:hypothetical protein